MLFQSYFFIFVFLPLALCGWYGLGRLNMHRAAQGYLIVVSLWFYCYFNLAYLGFLSASICANYLISLWIEKKSRTSDVDNTSYKNENKICLTLALILNVGALGFFKYLNFVIENLNLAFGLSIRGMEILLPLGISFITFCQLSFIIDRSKGKLGHPALLDYLSFVTFFPCLISGPIVTHGSTIQQFRDLSRRSFDSQRFYKGMVRFVLGLSKKVLLADTLARAVDAGYGAITSLDSLGAIVTGLFYTLELYFDFSGYSDMAIGIGLMFGIDIPENFRSPLTAVSVRDFWKKWHMTLSGFLTEYVYIPLGGSRCSKARQILNTMVTFLVSGIWHGANWTFVLWGFLHGLGVSLSSRKERTGILRKLCCIGTFLYVCFAFVFFRADTVADGWALILRMISGTNYGSLKFLAEAMAPVELYPVTKALSMVRPALLGPVQTSVLLLVGAFSIFLLSRERSEKIAEKKPGKWNAVLYAFLFFWSVISLSGVTTFVYFQF